MSRYEVVEIGRVSSSLTDLSSAPRQPDEGAPAAALVFDEAVRDALRGLEPGQEILVVTWLHLASRKVLQVMPRDDPARALTGVFGTRSPDRPNPFGLHRTRITAIDGLRIDVSSLEAVDGTPIVDVKPVLEKDLDRR